MDEMRVLKTLVLTLTSPMVPSFSLLLLPQRGLVLSIVCCREVGRKRGPIGWSLFLSCRWLDSLRRGQAMRSGGESVDAIPGGERGGGWRGGK